MFDSFEVAVAASERLMAALLDVASREYAAKGNEYHAAKMAELVAHGAQLDAEREAAVTKAAAEHRDRLAAAARRFGIVTGHGGNPASAHAVAWLNGAG